MICVRRSITQQAARRNLVVVIKIFLHLVKLSEINESEKKESYFD